MIRKDFPKLGEHYFEQRLANGLLVRVIEKPGFAKRYAFVATDYGSIDAEFILDGKKYTTPQGVAHYLEHKMFDLPEGNAMQEFAKYAGANNAFTSYTMTAYYVECTEHLEENLEILLRMVTTGYFTEESVQKERGITYLFIAHDLSVMRYISDRIAVIHKGDIVELADAEELVTHAIHPYTRSLLSAIPAASGRKSCWSMTPPCTTTPRRLPSGGSFGPVTGCSAAPPRPKTGAGNCKLFLAFFSLWPLCLLTFVLCSTTITGVAL